MTERMCVSCKKRMPKNKLVRISKQDDLAVIDQNKTQTNRAIYVCKNIKCMDILKKSNAIKRLLNATAKDEFYTQLDKHIEK